MKTKMFNHQTKPKYLRNTFLLQLFYLRYAIQKYEWINLLGLEVATSPKRLTLL